MRCCPNCGELEHPAGAMLTQSPESDLFHCFGCTAEGGLDDDTWWVGGRDSDFEMAVDFPGHIPKPRWRDDD